MLGLKSVKKTALYDGDVPIYHLYYGNDMGDESTLVTCFPMRQSGRDGPQGHGPDQTLIACRCPSRRSATGARAWPSTASRSTATTSASARRCLGFQHPCGIDYELVGIADDDRSPTPAAAVPQEYGIRGTHGITVSVRDLETSDEFMDRGWNGQPHPGGRRLASASRSAPAAPARSSTSCVEPQLDQAGWTFGEGIVHHCAFQVDDSTCRPTVKAHLEGLGFTDVSDRKDRGYFESVYVRTPGGALFEATVSKPEGFLIDEPYESSDRRSRCRRCSPDNATS